MRKLSQVIRALRKSVKINSVVMWSNTVSEINFILWILLLIISYLAWWMWNTIPGDLPPGPRGLPLLGYLPFLSKNSEVQLAEVSKKYGNVARLHVGSEPFVLLGDYNAVVEAFLKQKDTFIGRPLNNLLKIKNTDNGICITDGENWKQLRKFTLSAFKEFGIGQKSIEPQIINEIEHFLHELSHFKGESMDPANWLGVSVTNIFSVFEFGKRFEYTDKRFIELIKNTDEVMVHFGSMALRSLFSWSYNIPFIDKITGETRVKKIREKLREFMMDQVTEHLKHDGVPMNDYVDAFLQKRREILNETGTEGLFDLVALEANLFILFIAGSKTTITTLLWCVLYMALYPEVQKKVKEEIDNLIGNRSPNSLDRVPYTEATLLEIQRCASVVPLNLEHRNPEEAKLFGYRIPKDSRVISNLWAIHHDPNLWKEPNKFMPERFISNGQVERPDFLIPFSIGKHSCIGDNMAKLELHLYFISLLQRFDILPPPGTKLNLNSESGITRCPLPFKVRFIERKV